MSSVFDTVGDQGRSWTPLVSAALTPMRSGTGSHAPPGVRQVFDVAILPGMPAWSLYHSGRRAPIAGLVPELENSVSECGRARLRTRPPRPKAHRPFQYWVSLRKWLVTYSRGVARRLLWYTGQTIWCSDSPQRWAVVHGRVHAVDTTFQLIYSRTSSLCHCRVLSWRSKEPLMKATNALRPTAFPLTLTRLRVPPRFHPRPQLLNRPSPLPTGRDIASCLLLPAQV
jgi:hypothetical protein